MNGTNKLKRLSLVSFFSLVQSSTPAYWAHLKVSNADG
jgi:hypothetical protein